MNLSMMVLEKNPSSLETNKKHFRRHLEALDWFPHLRTSARDMQMCPTDFWRYKLPLPDGACYQLWQRMSQLQTNHIQQEAKSSK